MTRSLPGAGLLLAEQAAELPQKDELCGAFWGLAALRAAGLRAAPDGGPLDQDAVALAAGSVLSAPPRDGSLPPGEPGRDDFRLELPQAGAGEHAGTSARGLARAIAELSGGALAVVPASGTWPASALIALVEAVARASAPVAVLANVAAGELWEPGVSGDQQARYLEWGLDTGTASPWRVGHFAAIVGIERGPVGTLLTIADSYPSLGPGAVHRQPVERVAAALRRDGDRPAGLLLAVAAGEARRTAELVRAAGLEVALWDNGSPDARA